MGISTPTSLRQRTFRRNDIQAVLSIERNTSRAPWNWQVLRAFVQSPQTSVRVITTNSRPEVPIAFFVVQWSNGVLYLANIVVAPSWRRSGVGAFALKQVEVIARRLSCLRMTLDVKERNLPAQLLYRSVGFKAVEIMHGFYGRQDGYRMVKELRPPLAR